MSNPALAQLTDFFRTSLLLTASVCDSVPAV